MHANSREDIKEANAGDIVALAGLKYTITGHTLCDKENAVLLEPMEFPDPVIEIAVEPKTKADQEKMGEALGRLAKEDPSFRVTSDEESGQTIIKGMGELHLDIIADRLKREFKVEVNQGKPQVEYKEALTGQAKHRETYKKQTGGRGKFADIVFTIEPGEEGKPGLEFVNEIKGGNVPKEYVPSGEADIMSNEPFGPVAVSRSFETFDEVIEQANRLPYGLAAFAFTENSRRANLLGDALEAGMVGINNFAISSADAPFGGIKHSGFGSEGGPEGLASYQVTKAIHQA